MKKILTQNNLPFCIIFLFTFQVSVKAGVLKPSDHSSIEQNKIAEILTNVFYEELYKRTKHLKPEIEVKKRKISINDGRRGKMIIEMKKQRNREKIARLRGFDPKKVKSGADLVKLQKADTKLVLENMREEQKALEEKYAHLPPRIRGQKIWQEQAKQEMSKLRYKVLKDHKEWRKKHTKTLTKWKEGKGEYEEDIDNYKETLINIPLILPVSKKEAKKNVEVKIVREHYLIPGSLELSVRDQKRRPTCSAFSGLRAIEIMLAQNSKKQDLSEQYFYWASKPDCQSRNCSRAGSWVGHGLEHSQNSSTVDIPAEQSCSYKDNSIIGNETQRPLKDGCTNGKVKVKSFSYHKTLDDVVRALKNKKSVMASIKLSPNFYTNKGLILDKESKAKGKTDSHAAGHAVLLIGYLKLPKILNEGSVCFITANSWGIGWGHGGHACISEKWLLNHRKMNPFVVMDAIEI